MRLLDVDDRRSRQGSLTVIERCVESFCDDLMTSNFLFQSSTLSRFHYHFPANDRFSVPALEPFERLGTRVHVICAWLKRRLAPRRLHRCSWNHIRHRADFPFTHYRRENIPFYCPLVLFKELEETPWRVSHHDLPNPCYGGLKRRMVICHSNVSIFAARSE